jgi:hypothetical protein
MATVSTKMVLDTTGFNRGIKSAESSMSKFKSMAGTAAMAGIAAGFAAAAAATVGLAAGIKNVLDIGGALSDLSSRTGVAAGELRVLQEAFKQNGLSADQVGTTINKMQRALVEAGQKGGETARAFDTLGLNLDGLRAMSSADQLQTIGNAIAALPDPAARAAAAMQIFGRSGGELLTLFSNSGALSDAATTIGTQADLLTKNANMFDRASDILNSVGAKLEGFFVGVADQVVPAIMPLLEAANSIDLASIGQDLGQAIAFALTAITSGQIGNLLTAQLKLSGAQFVNTLVSGLLGLVSAFATIFGQIPENFVTILGIVTKPEFWAGVGQGLLSAAQKFAAIINGAAAALLEALAKVPGLGGLSGLASGFRDTQSGLEASAASNADAAAQNLQGPIDTIRAKFLENLDEVIANVGSTLAAVGDTIDTSELEAARDGIVNTISEQMKANEEAARARFEATKTATPLFDAEGMGGAGKSNTGVIAQSLQKVGGGAAFARFSDSANPAAEAVREQKKSNGYLQTIAEGINYIRNGDGALMPA